MSQERDRTPIFFRDLRGDYGELLDTSTIAERDAAMAAWKGMSPSEQRYHMARLQYAVVRGLAHVQVNVDSIGQLVGEGLGQVLDHLGQLGQQEEPIDEEEEEEEEEDQDQDQDQEEDQDQDQDEEEERLDAGQEPDAQQPEPGVIDGEIVSTSAPEAADAQGAGWPKPRAETAETE